MTLQEVVDKIKMLASQAGVSDSPYLDTTMLSELVLPRCASVIAKNVTKDTHQVQALRRDFTVSFTSGVGTLPEAVKDEYAETGFIPTTESVYAKQWYQYNSGFTSVFPRWTIRNRNIYYTGANGSPGSYTGNITFNFVALPVFPSSASSTVDIKDNILEQIITMAANVVANKIPLPEADY